MGDKDERDKALSVNVERGAGIFCKIVIVCFLSVRCRPDGLYYKMAGTPSSPTRFFIRVETSPSLILYSKYSVGSIVSTVAKEIYIK